MAMLKETNKLFGGIQVRNDNNINSNLFCELCKLLLLNPTQLLCCGTRLCRWCSKKGLPNREPFICPFCNTKQHKRQEHADRGVERELNILNIECYSCSWNGSYRDYLEHLQQHHADLECSNCHERFSTVNSCEEHQQEICEYRRVPCGLPGCVELVIASEMHRHCLDDKHQNMLLEFLIQFIYSKNNSNRLTTKVNMTQELISIQESIVILSPGIETLSNDCTRLRSEHNQIQTISERIIPQINETKKLANENMDKINKHIQLQNQTEKELDDTKKLYPFIKIILLNVDGAMIFSFNKHRDDINSPFSMFSPTFKSSSFGYSFILRVCSTMDPADENKGYLSIYIALVRGDYDPILFYPFRYNISLYLCDQSGQGKDIKSTITPDPKSPPFARPSSEKNVEVGVVKFCPLNYLRDADSIYLKDGVVFIRVFIDFMNAGSLPFG